MSLITIENHKLTINSNPGLSLLNNFVLNQAPIHTICGGRARCGCCRIKITSGQEGTTKVNEGEIARLGNKLIEEGWRLSCQTHSIRDLSVYMPTADELDKICCESPR